MKNMRRSLGFVAAVLVLSLAAGVRGAEGDAPKRGTRIDPEAIDKALTGDLALSAEQKTKLNESYDKTVKAAREKITATADVEAKKALYKDMMTAMDNFKASVKTILKEEQYKKVEEMLAPKKKAN